MDIIDAFNKLLRIWDIWMMLWLFYGQFVCIAIGIGYCGLFYCKFKLKVKQSNCNVIVVIQLSEEIRIIGKRSKKTP